MNNQYYQLSTDEKEMLFYRAIPDPTIELQHSLTQALNEADELRCELSIQKTNADNFGVAAKENFKYVKELQTKVAEIESENTTLWIVASNFEDQLVKSEAQNTLANEALTAIAKQLGFESFADDEVMIAIESLLLNPKWEQLAKEWKQSSENSKILCDEIKQENEILLDNLNRSQSDRLSELTNIMRMIQALSDTPQDCYYGALRLIRQVIYNAICKLDTSQSWDA